jgi:hypothetical protein
MNRIRVVVSIVVIAALAACSDLFSPGAKTQLKENRDKWRAQGMTSYTFTLRQSCFCAITGPVRVSFSNGSVIRATQNSNGQTIDTRFVSTIESLIDFIERGIENHYATLEVTYDPTLGYPAVIVSDGSRNVADDEVTYEVSDVRSGVMAASR